ncbi:T9SS type B sorting domain-containing protein [Aquimarina gracilis]|uniref:T9SS type B sorting domain-containing protein n=1 Tax=Aquimarina gracilis TaxID=874422 RepID=A0ABU6A0Y0_9FLAO|nr:T9SS type B sorting domain-containing protein [Aquimarina gracilis]MEB3347779.1 T9SS type B sorting domain-containing protein [Aquimarina gracilis]
MKSKVLTLIMNKGNCQRLTLVLIMLLSTVGLFGQQGFRPRQDISTKGDVLMIGNAIHGRIQDPNGDYNTLGTNNGSSFQTSYIDIDGDNTTFSSSSADLEDPNIGCTEIIYAGLYWSANYYLAREDSPNNYSSDEVDVFQVYGITDSDSNTILNINNSQFRGRYFVRNSEFSNDVSNIRLSPASANLVVAQPTNGCSITNGAQLAGNIAVIQSGSGGCSDRERVVNAQNAGAVGVVLINDNGNLHRLTGNGTTTITIPSVSMGNNNFFCCGSQNPITELLAETEVVNATLSTTGDEQETGLPTNDTRKTGTADFQNILFGFGAPGAVTYNAIAPQAGTMVIDVNGVPTTTHGGVIYDGYLNSATNPGTSASDNVPYVCYADVTSIVQANGYGTYTVGNMKATVGVTSGVSGATGGWTLVVIYSDPDVSAVNRFISVFDGFREIQGGSSASTVDLPISGFRTLPAPNPVNVRFGAATLEGDSGIDDDNLQIQNTSNNYVDIFNAANPQDNFFNSSISLDGVVTTNRNPASANTLGFDSDIFELENDAKDLIPNGATSADFRLETNGDTYQAFMTVFSIEEIVPELRILKEVYDPSDLSTVINNQSVELGDQLIYRLRIENTGNEDYNGNVIVDDILPANVDLVSVDGIDIAANPTGNLSTIPSISYTSTGVGTGGVQTIQFSIPPNLLTHSEPGIPGTGELTIDFRVQLVADCLSLRDACSDEINNVAQATYTGILSGVTVTDDPSSSALLACGNTDGLATNFLANVPACPSDVSFCGGVLQLVAGDGYDRYTWSGPNGFSEVTTTNVVNIPTGTAGVYTVIKEDTDPSDGTCMTLTEEFTVTDFTTIAHPLEDNADPMDPDFEDFIEYFDDSNGGCNVPLAKINLCGDQTYTLNTGFVPGNLINITWQELTNNACLDRDDNCPAITGGCDAIANWTNIATPPLTTSLDFDTAGEYRVVVEFDGGCTQVFYFDVNKNDYQPLVDVVDMECDNDGSVQVNNIPPGDTYRFLIRPQGDPAPTVADVALFTNSDGLFPITFQTNPFDFTVYAIDTAFPNCVYEIDGTVRSFDPEFRIRVVDPTCVNNDNGNGLGDVFVEVIGGIPQYEYRLVGGPNNVDLVSGNSDASNGDFAFRDLDPGTYDIEIVSNRNPDPECVYSTLDDPTLPKVIIDSAPAFTAEARITAPPTCTSGAIVEIVVTSSGTGPYQFAELGGVFSTNNTFTLPDTATTADIFTYQVSDTSVTDGCIIEVEVRGPEPYQPIVIQSVNPVDPLCPTDLGRIEVTLDPASDVAGRTFTFELLDNTNTPIATQTATGVTFPSPGPFTFANVPSGTGYTVRVSHNNTTDPTAADICPIEDGTYDIGGVTAVSFDANVTKPLTCVTGDEDAQVTINNFAGGSTGTWEWSLDPDPMATWNAVPGSGTVTINVATAQTGFTVYVRDPAAINCAVPESVDIDPLLDLDSVVVANERDADCINQTFVVDVSASPALSAADVTNGVEIDFTVSPAPASGPATFSITTSAGVQALTFNRDVTYTITATRTDNQCSANTTLFRDLINEIAILNAAQDSQVSCNGGSDGAFSFTVDTSLFPTFNFEIYDSAIPVPGTATPIFTGSSSTATTTVDSGDVALDAGTYTIRVIDPASGATVATSCFAEREVTITQPDPITFDIDPVEQTCPTGNTVTISNVQGGSGTGYTYILYDDSPTTGGTPIGPSRPINQPYENVPAGTGYVIIVTDGTTTCSSAEQTVPDIIALTDPVIAEGTVDYCLGINADETFPDNTVSFEIDITTPGTGEHFYTVTRDGTLVIPSTSLGVIAAPTTFSTTPPPALDQAGVYQFIVTDSKGCASTPVDITIEEPIELTAAFVRDILCNASGDPGDPDQAGEILLTRSNGYAPISPATNYIIEVSTDNGATFNPTTISGPGLTFTFNTATPGIYRFRISDGRGCKAISEPVELTAPVDPIFSAADVALLCADDTGEVIVNINGPDNYTISFNSDPPIPVTSAQTSFSGIAPNNLAPYGYTITSDKGCIYNGTVNVTSPEPITISEVSRDDLDCIPDGMGGNIGTPGQITLAIDGGNPDASLDADDPLITYELIKDGVTTAILPVSPPPANPTAVDQIQYPNLDPGIYTVIVTDDNGCSQDFDFTIADIANDLNLNLAVGSDCITGAIVDLTIIGGTGPYELSYNSELGPIGPILLAGNTYTTLAGELDFGIFYTFEVVDTSGSGCRFFITRQVPPPAAPTIVLGTPVPEQCENADDGEIEFTVDNYSPIPTTLTWEVRQLSDNAIVLSGGPVAAPGGPVPINTNTFTAPIGATGLPPGRYYIRVTEDAGGGRGCSTASADFLIEEAEPLDLTAGTELQGNCNEPSRVTMTTTGGNPFTSGTTDGYLYLRVDEIAGSPAIAFAALTAANFTAPAAANTVISTTNTIDLGSTAGTAFYIAAIDDNDCIVGYERVVAAMDTEPTISFVPPPPPGPFVDDPCNYDNNYTFTVSGIDGVLIGGTSYTYEIEIDDSEDPTDVPRTFTDTDAGTFQFTVTSAGLYRVTIIDANGCRNSDTIRVYDPLEFDAEFITPPTCNDPDGVVQVELTSGIPAGTLTYAITGINGTPNPATAVQGPVIVGPPQTTTFTGVPPGEYQITITDPDRGPAGCPFTTTVSIEAPIEPVLIAPVTNPIVSCIGAEDATLTAILRGDPAPPAVTPPSSIDPRATYMYQIVSGPVPPPLTVPTALQSSPSFPNLGAGTYRVRVVATLNNGTSGSPPAPLDVECEFELDYTIDAPTVVSFGLAPGDAFSCSAGNVVNTATINITGISGGTPPYTVRVVEPAPSTVVRVINVPTPVTDPFPVDAPVITGGTYSIQVIDSNNCPVTAQTIAVPGLPTMTSASAAPQVSATCTNDETVRVTVVGGSGNYSFEGFDDTNASIGIINPIAGIDFADFPLTGGEPGDFYRFVITDEGTMCTIDTNYTIPEFDFLEVRAQEESSETCFEEEDGRARVFILGYAGEFSYTIVDASATIVYDSAAQGTNETTDGDITTEDSFVVPRLGEPGLGIGNYTINITEIDAPECTDSANFNIMGPTNDFEIVLDARNDQESCDPGTDGAYQASFTGAQGPIGGIVVRYELTGPVNQNNTTGTFTNLPAGSYTVTAYNDIDGAGPGTLECTDTDTFTIFPPADDVAITNVVDNDVSCFGEQDGSIVVTANGTDTPLRYELRNAVGDIVRAQQTSATFDLLAPGNYTITVYDDLNCTETAPAVINEKAELTVNFDATLITCIGNPNPSITATVTGGFDTSTGGIIDGRTIVTYVVMDASDPLNPVELTRNNTGIFPLTEGNYQFFVIDSNNCQSDLSALLPVIPIPDIEIDLDERFAFVNCNGGANGVIDASVTGGTGAYTYTLSTVGGVLSDGTPFTPIVQSNSEFRDLAPAQYIYTVTSERSCEAEDRFTIINPPLFEPVFTPSNVTCEGFDNGTIRIDASGGTPPYSFAINNEEFLNDVSDGEIGSHVFEELAPGTYTVIAQDALGCSEIRDIEITEPDALMVAVDGEPTPETCFGDADGAVTVIITGGTEPYRTNITNNDADFVEGLLTYENLPAGITTVYIIDANDCRTELPVTIEPGVILNAVLSDRLECPVIDNAGNVIQPPRYFIDFVLGDDSVTEDIVYTLIGINGTPNPTSNFNMTGEFEVAPGQYEGTMLHANGCEESAGTIEVDVYEPLSLPVAQMTNNPLDPNEYEIIVSGGIPPYTYFVSFDGVEEELESNIFAIRQTGDYVLRVVDSSGCEVIATQFLTYINIRIPNYFTPDDPNGTPEERFWYPRQITPNIDDPFFFENMEVMVFDRYGRMLAEFKGDQQGWDGLYQGKQLPSGDYWFTIQLNDIDKREFTGHFTLYR